MHRQTSVIARCLLAVDRVAPAAIGLALTSLALAEVPPIERMVPAETILVFGARDVSASRVRLDATPIGAFIRDERMQELIRESFDEPELRAALAESGLDSLEDLIPRGGMGMALFLEMDEDLGLKRPAFLLAADYGDKAEAIAALIRERMGETAREQGVQTEERQVRGRTVAILEIPIPEPAADDDAADGEFDDEFAFDPFGGLEFDPAILFDGMRTIHFVRDAERLMISSSLLAIEDALGAVDGEALRSSLAENPEFQEAIGQIGGPNDAYGGLFTAPLQQMIGPIAGMQLAMVQPFVAQLFGDIRAHTIGVALDEGESMATVSVGTLVPRGRVGLLTLVDGAAPRGPLPAFVGADALGYGTMSLRLDRLMPMVNGFVQALPPMVGEMANPMLDQFGPALEQAFGGLGPEMHSVTFAPSDPEGPGQTVVVLRCARVEAVNSLVAMFAPGIGLMPRDFLGQTIYSGEEMPISVGLGGGWMVIGADEGVERVLRSVGQADLPTLADEAAFRQATAALPAGDLLGWGFQDMIGTARVQHGMILDMLQAAGDDAGLDADRTARIIAELSDPDLLERYFGPQAWTFTSDDRGLIMRSMFLRPTAAD